MKQNYHQTLLKDELEKRAKKNPHFSQSSFAKFLNINKGSLSKIMKGERSLSWMMAQDILQKLSLNESQSTKFLLSLALQQRDSESKRKDKKLKDFLSQHGEKKFTKYLRDKKVKDLSLSVFKLIADWYHLAILQLIRVEDFKYDHNWMAAKLNISTTKVKLAVERLIELDLLREENGTLIRTKESFMSADRHLTTKAHKKRQSDIMDLSKNSLMNDDISLRNHTAMTMAIDPDLIPEAKERISTFMQELNDFLESKNNKKVYELTINLFPLQKD